MINVVQKNGVSMLIISLGLAGVAMGGGQGR